MVSGVDIISRCLISPSDKGTLILTFSLREKELRDAGSTYFSNSGFRFFCFRVAQLFEQPRLKR
ncbi:MAG: hypothetical protein DME97_12690 [Verrucomicrobia bacterium]|nr:MAG: hypothetical protein DME97_12690 [Verrucomicrobiota bacterium]